MASEYLPAQNSGFGLFSCVRALTHQTCSLRKSRCFARFLTRWACRWEARIYEAGKQRFLGYHTSETSAARAYDARAVQLHGAAAKVNFPEEHEVTRFNAPAVKPGGGMVAASRLAGGPSPDLPRRKSPRDSSWNSTCTR